jgi:hypothetical protein
VNASDLSRAELVETILSSLRDCIEIREATPGRPEDGPYPATVGEVADEIVEWLQQGGHYANGLAAAVAERLAHATEWGARWSDGGYCPASPPRNEEFARKHAGNWGTTVIRRSVGPWVVAATGEPAFPDVAGGAS